MGKLLVNTALFYAAFILTPQSLAKEDKTTKGDNNTQESLALKTLTINASGFKNNKGQACIKVFQDKKGYDDLKTVKTMQKCSPISQNKVTFSFQLAPKKEYGVSMLHDEDANGEMKTNWIGMPKEGIGVSNNAKGRFGPPSWKQVKFLLNNNKSIEIKIKNF